MSAAMGENEEDRAWDLWRQVFDHQDEESGMIPDAYSNYTLYYGTYKPPVHGWALMKMIQANPKILTKERIEDAYSVLTKWTNFWFKYQDDNRNGIPNYNIGCDSGWDNATVFMVNAGSGLEAPDLCAYLVLQMETLAYLADEMGNKKESKQWTSRSKELLNRLVNELWNGELFAYRRTSDLMLSTTQSLIHYMPLLLGDRLPKEISNKMVNDLKTKGFLTKYGFASEHPDSEHFVEDGYWQGALWSPPTLMLSYGARGVGDEDFAKEIVERFCNTCNEFGFPENFSALTGKPLRDMSLPWMSSVFMILGHDFLNEK
jgi:glycogen debranching enzyme